MNKQSIQILSENIRWLRSEKRLSAIEMARLLDVREESLIKLEEGILMSDIMLDILFIIEKEFGIKAYKFISEKMK